MPTQHKKYIFCPPGEEPDLLSSKVVFFVCFEHERDVKLSSTSFVCVLVANIIDINRISSIQQSVKMIRNFSSALIASASLSFSTANFLHTPFAGIGTRDSQQSIRLLAFSQPISFYRKEKVNLKLFHHRDRSSSAEKVTLESFAEQLKSNGFKRILVVVGAGVSCSAGIPDFRTPGSGL